MVKFSVSFLIAAIIATPALAKFTTLSVAYASATSDNAGTTSGTANTTDAYCHQDAETPTTCDGTDGWNPVSVTGKKGYYCSKGPICAGESGYCPGVHRDLGFGSSCVKLSEGIHHCVPNTECPVKRTKPNVHENCEVPPDSAVNVASAATKEPPNVSKSHKTTTLPTHVYAQIKQTSPHSIIATEHQTVMPLKPNEEIPSSGTTKQLLDVPVQPTIDTSVGGTTDTSTEAPVQPTEETPSYGTTDPPIDEPTQTTDESPSKDTTEPPTVGPLQPTEQIPSSGTTVPPTDVPVQPTIDTSVGGITDTSTEAPVQPTEETPSYGTTDPPIDEPTQPIDESPSNDTTESPTVGPLQPTEEIPSSGTTVPPTDVSLQPTIDTSVGGTTDTSTEAPVQPTKDNPLYGIKKSLTDLAVIRIPSTVTKESHIELPVETTSFEGSTGDLIDDNPAIDTIRPNFPVPMNRKPIGGTTESPSIFHVAKIPAVGTSTTEPFTNSPMELMIGTSEPFSKVPRLDVSAIKTSEPPTDATAMVVPVDETADVSNDGRISKITLSGTTEPPTEIHLVNIPKSDKAESPADIAAIKTHAIKTSKKPTDISMQPTENAPSYGNTMPYRRSLRRT